MVALWKIKREISRAWIKSFSPLIGVFYRYRMRRHDLEFEKKVTLTKGLCAQGEKIALFLIYQPDGLHSYIIEACKEISKAGFSTLVVSNSKISKTDLDLLRPHAFLILDRQNFGYDFGGYRDAILHILKDSRNIERLLIMNDSCWFPTIEGNTFLKSVSETNFDLFGAVSASKRNSNKRFHIQSYAFSFGPRILKSEMFRRYWQSLVVASDRFWTVENCEKGMANWFSENGFSVGAAWTYDDIEGVLQSVRVSELEQVLEYEIAINVKHADRLKSVMQVHPHDDTWKRRVFQLLEDEVFRRSVYLSHPILLMKLGFPFLKRKKEPQFQVQRAAFLKLNDTNLNKIVRAEISAYDDTAGGQGSGA